MRLGVTAHLFRQSTRRLFVMRKLQARVYFQVLLQMRRPLALVLLARLARVDFVHAQINGLRARDATERKRTHTGNVDALPFDPVRVCAPQTHGVRVGRVPVDRSGAQFAAAFDRGVRFEQFAAQLGRRGTGFGNDNAIHAGFDGKGEMRLFVIALRQLNRIDFFAVSVRRTPGIVKARIDAAHHGQQEIDQTFGQSTDVDSVFQFATQKERAFRNALQFDLELKFESVDRGRIVCCSDDFIDNFMYVSNGIKSIIRILRYSKYIIYIQLNRVHEKYKSNQKSTNK